MSATLHIEQPTSGEEIHLLAILGILLKRWRAVIGIPVIAALAVLGISFLIPPTYTATSSFVPEVRSQSRLPAGLVGLVSQFNIPLGLDGSESPRFYADVARSRKILDRLLVARY